jgi:hypothetical protein
MYNKFTIEQAMKPQRRNRGIALSLTSALDGVGGQRHALAALPPGKRPGTHCIGGWVGPKAGLEGCRKSRPPTGIRSWTVQPIVSRYTDYTIPTHVICIIYNTT